MGRMTARQFAEWAAYAEVEPFGEERADLRAGIIASVQANAWRDKDRRPFKPSDFMPKFGKSRARTVAEESARAMAWVASVGGKVVTSPVATTQS